MGNPFGTKTTQAIPTTYYLGLSKTAPTISGMGVSEPSTSDTGYGRVSLASLSAPTNGTITNSAPVSFNESTSNLGTMTHYVVYDAVTGGNLLFYGTLSISRTVEQDTVITVKAGELTITLSNPA